MSGAPGTHRAPKIQRWIDLLAALLSRHYPATFAELARDIPAYKEGAKAESALMRMFERDKDELRALGIPIETVQIEHGERSAYRLGRRDFYLPYLCAVSSSGRRASRSARIDRYGYQTLATLAFEPEELAALAQAAARVNELGDPLLIEEIRSAMRKLALDLPIDMTASDGDMTVVAPRSQADAAMFGVLDDALRRRKTVEFVYRSMNTDRTEKRHVDPYGLFFISGHWYLAGRDRDRAALRNFRMERMTDLSINPLTPQTADYTIPAAFRLREHARSRQAWELGDGDPILATVKVVNETGASLAAARLGAESAQSRLHRVFEVRRMDAFVRWLLSFGGDVAPVSPPELVAAFQYDVRRTLDAYSIPAVAHD